ncbi:MAG: 2Fe-2S iron-sulfur cluster binding domain-containing protein, partial [Deltaproteobacteria bacterium]|nr:2Fe-2S iron-sulfur cluster binding domain-containing protein [Deltaproteobacteria bacterium]
MDVNYKLTLKIRRYDPDTKESWVQNYVLEVGRILRFTDLFRKINNELDASLAWNSSCEHAQCGTCAVKVNGETLLACELLVENAVNQFGTTIFHIEPITIAPVVRDLIVDLEK